MNLSRKLLLLLFVAFLMTNCGGGSTSKETSEKNRKKLTEEKTIHDIGTLLEDLPPPSLVPFTLKSIGTAYNKNLINSVDKMESYKSNRDKMVLNMGIYACDINYLAIYGREEECMKYLETAHTMAEFLGDSAIYDHSHLEKFRKYIKDDQEKIPELLSKLFIETSLQMEEDHHLTMAGLALTGSFIEGLYQVVTALESYPDTKKTERLLEPLVKIVLDEEKVLIDIIQILDDLPFDDTIADMISELSILDKLYKGDLQQIEEKIKSDPDFILTKEMMGNITQEVKRIRTSIVE